MLPILALGRTAAVSLALVLCAAASPTLARAQAVTRTTLKPPRAAERRALAPLFRAAFGRDPPVTSTFVPHWPMGDSVTYRPMAALHMGKTTVLLSSGEVKSDCHGCSGVLSIHYLKRTSRGWKVTGHWAPPVASSWGHLMGVSVLRGLTPNLVVSNDGGMANCGCSEDWNDLIELTPHGARYLAQVPQDPEHTRYSRGRRPGEFTVRYSKRYGSVVYHQVGGRYVPSRHVVIQDCSAA